jgi:SHS2 domain-containing protein
MFELIPHTADVRIRLRNEALHGLFEDAGQALIAFSDVTCDVGPLDTRELTVESVDRTSLLVDFLNELLAMLHVERLAFRGLRSASVGESRFDCVATFAPVDTWAEDVKAVTYHEAALVREGELWSTVVVLDI